MLATFDPRTTPARPDLAAATLRGKIEARDFVEGEQRMVIAPIAPLRRAPNDEAPLDTQALRGEVVQVFDEAEGWCWAQLARDNYVGYLPSVALGRCEEANAKVGVMRTFVYPGPNLKLPVVDALPFGAACRVDTTVDSFSRIAEGYVWTGHLQSLDDLRPDYVAVAEQFLGVPYLWGGRSSFGIDCSGLVQVSLAAAGVAAPRDSDMQAQALGQPCDREKLRRGDFVWWPGHVGIMRDGTELLHANGHTMLVSSEPLAVARDRILAATGHDISQVRRLTVG